MICSGVSPVATVFEISSKVGAVRRIQRDEQDDGDQSAHG
jgi:hypothetical protein